MDRVSADFFFDYSSGFGQFSAHQCEINLFHSARGKLPGQVPVGGIIFGDDETTTRLLVETMNDSGALFPANSRQRCAVVKQCIDQSVFAVTRTRMNDQPRRFIDHNEVVVFEQNLKWNRFWQGLDLFQRWLGELNLIATSDKLAWPAG